MNEQAGIEAGSGGFAVNVKGNTDLKGAYIAGTADASKNSLTTGTLTYGDIEDHSHYSAASNGISVGVGVGSTGKAVGPGSVSGSGGVVPMISQDANGDQGGTGSQLLDKGKQFVQSTLDLVPGHKMADQAQVAFANGNYTGAIGFAIGSVGDAALGVLTLGEGKALTSTVAAVEGAISKAVIGGGRKM